MSSSLKDGGTESQEEKELVSLFDWLEVREGEVRQMHIALDKMKPLFTEMLPKIRVLSPKPSLLAQIWSEGYVCKGVTVDHWRRRMGLRHWLRGLTTLKPSKQTT
jgi:hypothetical protein